MQQKYLLIAFFILTGCSVQDWGNNQDLLVINIPQYRDEHEVKLSSFVDSLSYIPFETKDECLVGAVDKIIVPDDFYFFNDEY